MQREVILIFGQTGSGKSYHARQIARTHPRVLVADAGFGDFSPIPSVASYEGLLDYLEKSGAFSGSPFRVSYDFKLYDGEGGLAFETAMRLGDCLLVVEEADRFTIDEPEYQEILYRGRHYGCSLLFIALQPTSIPTDVRRQATEIIAYRQVLPDDVAWLSKIVGEEAFKLPGLSGPPARPPNPYLRWTQSGGACIVGKSGPALRNPGLDGKSTP